MDDIIIINNIHIDCLCNEYCNNSIKYRKRLFIQLIILDCFCLVLWYNEYCRLFQAK